MDGSAEQRPGVEAHAARALAMVVYGLVIASFFTAWITGLIAWLLAFLNRRDPDPIARSHFRHQLKITDIFGVASAIGIGLALWGGWTVIAPLFQGDQVVWTWGLLLRAGGLGLLGAAVWGVATLVAMAMSIAGMVRLASSRAAGRTTR